MPAKLDISAGTRPCRVCLETKPLELFSRGQGRVRRSACKPCVSASEKAYRVKNRPALREKEIARNKDPRRARAFRDSSYQRLYGITLENYESKFRSQDGACAICKKHNLDGKALAVDHNHATGVVRGLLCRKCNITLGFINDDIRTVTAMFDYLEKWQLVVSK